jgi:flagellar motor protein MotB
MKKIISLATVFLIATTFGCKDAPAPKTQVNVESASEAARNDDRAIAKRLSEQKSAVDEKFSRERAQEARQRNVDALRALASRWQDGLIEASGTPRFDIAGPLKKLQSIKAEADTIEVDDCTGSARITLQSSMAASMEAFTMFQKETGESADATTNKVQQGADLLLASRRQMDACLTKY